MIKTPLKYPRNPTLLDPFKHLLKTRTWDQNGIFFDKTNEWGTWQWANVKIDKESLTLFKKIINIPKEDMEDYHWAMFTHAMDFF